MERLREMGYRYGQGFHMARPLSAADFAELMAGTAGKGTAAGALPVRAAF
jgi:EAL domain-containing protein (putative c-di-GMP-specific phosphodiesterase class I)